MSSPSAPEASILRHTTHVDIAHTTRSVAHFAGSRSLAFTIRASKIQGKGAFATRVIRKGERIIEYLGECIDDAESDIRYPDGDMGRHHTFLFAIGDGTRVLDAGPLDWPAKYINHSCDPNCEATEEEDGRVFIAALRKIEVGTELLYDYAYERTPDHTPEDEKLYRCRCGAATCRGSILAPPKKKKDKKGKKSKKKDKKHKKDRVPDAAPAVAASAPAVAASAPAAGAATREQGTAAKRSVKKRSVKKRPGAKQGTSTTSVARKSPSKSTRTATRKKAAA